MMGWQMPALFGPSPYLLLRPLLLLLLHVLPHGKPVFHVPCTQPQMSWMECQDGGDPAVAASPRDIVYVLGGPCAHTHTHTHLRSEPASRHGAPCRLGSEACMQHVMLFQMLAGATARHQLS